MRSLTAKEKIEVLTLAKEKLGRGGKNWVKGEWFAKNPVVDKYGPSGEECAASEATCFCLEGALEIAAVELGHRQKPVKKDRAARLVSIHSYVTRKFIDKPYNEPKFDEVNEFNDDSRTTWKDILAVINGRIRELEKEL